MGGDAGDSGLSGTEVDRPVTVRLPRPPLDRERRREVLEGGAGRIEDRDLVARRAPGPRAGHDLGELGVDLLASHQAGGERVLELAELGALRERVDHQRRAGDEPRIELLLAMVVRADGGDERARPDVLDADEVTAGGGAGGAD